MVGGGGGLSAPVGCASKGGVGVGCAPDSDPGFRNRNVVWKPEWELGSMAVQVVGRGRSAS